MFHTGSSFEYSYDISRKNGLEEAIEASAEFLSKKLSLKPQLGIICSTHLGFVAECLEEPLEIPFSTLPHFQSPTFRDLKGKMIIGRMYKIPVLFLVQEMYLYDGHPLWKCTIPIRLMKSLDIQVIFTINTAKSVNKFYKKGDIMIIQDHIDITRLFGNFSLRGPEGNLFQFNKNRKKRIYDKNLIETSLKIAKEIFDEKRVKRGVYAYSAVPNQESGADVNFLRRFGSDAVGSSSVHEAIVAGSCGMTVFGFSVIVSGFGEEICNFGGLEEGNEDRVGVREFLKKIVECACELQMVDFRLDQSRSSLEL